MCTNAKNNNTKSPVDDNKIIRKWWWCYFPTISIHEETNDINQFKTSPKPGISHKYNTKKFLLLFVSISFDIF